MPASARHSTDTHTHTEYADLGKLAAEMTTRGYQAELRTPADRLPFLAVCNPAASVLTEHVYTQDDSYWFSWGEHIAGCHEPATAAALLARVLRTVDAQ